MSLTRALLASLFVAALAGCGDQEEIPAEERPAAAACEADVQCASRVCVASGQCPDGRAYEAFCGGDPCEAGDCPIGDKCITLGRDDGPPLQLCIPIRICN